MIPTVFVVEYSRFGQQVIVDRLLEDHRNEETNLLLNLVSVHQHRARNVGSSRRNLPVTHILDV